MVRIVQLVQFLVIGGFERVAISLLDLCFLFLQENMQKSSNAKILHEDNSKTVRF